MVFALFSLQIYMGVLRQKCVANPPAYTGTPAYTYDQYYNDFIKNTSKYSSDIVVLLLQEYLINHLVFSQIFSECI